MNTDSNRVNTDNKLFWISSHTYHMSIYISDSDVRGFLMPYIMHRHVAKTCHHVERCVVYPSGSRAAG